MSMHLVGPYLTTTNYRKRKSKVTQSQMNRWMDGWREKCKQNKRLGLAKPTFEEYVDFFNGDNFESTFIFFFKSSYDFLSKIFKFL